ncbi:hypothetical protein FOVG_18571 [Fusarium oxysporum f. sp. pisi HDV247]|uniref:Amine oxidase domain-containing protein n=1 Tax=Fusarium oxysporum f. sp. pisi HDV247 TaxID=1080344 RepID=W9NBG4_FUSOX|nr:hypothetical protein FOVG_18571 [Fusarium oxysporum f. sp. pisi HDV247]
MKFSTSAVVLASCLSSVSAAATKHSGKCVDVDVAVIGGGSSGIHAAIGLKDAGAKVAVIEKKSQIGGHAETYINPDTKIPANIGVVLFENTETVKKYFQRLGVETAENNPITSTGQSKSYDFSLGIPIPAQDEAAAKATQEAMTAAGLAYAANVLTKYPWIDQGYFVPNPVPEELLQPFGQFAQQNNFSAILPLISQLNWYPGNITTIPALYGIKGLGAGLLQSVGSNFLVAKSGNTRSLYDAAAKELGNSVYLNSNVLSVQRNKKGVVVVIKQRGKTVTIRARKLVVAIPQTLENVKPFDLCETERNVFSKFSALGYVAGVANIPGLDVSLQNVGALTPANTPIVPGSNGYFTSGSPNQYLLGVAFDNTDYTIADAKAVIERELTTLAAVGALPADASKKVTYPLVSNHAPYNLRVSRKDIASGFYSQLLCLEGYRNTYWTGAAFAGHNSGLIWNWNEGTVLPALKKELGL